MSRSMTLARMFHKLRTPSLVSCPHKEFSSVGRNHRYATPSENPSCEQYPARSSRESMKHAGCTLRAYQSKTDAYRVFRKMLDSGNPPDDWASLLAEARRATGALRR